MTGPGAFSKGIKLYFIEKYGLDLEKLDLTIKQILFLIIRFFRQVLLENNLNLFLVINLLDPNPCIRQNQVGKNY